MNEDSEDPLKRLGWDYSVKAPWHRIHHFNIVDKFNRGTVWGRLDGTYDVDLWTPDGMQWDGNRQRWKSIDKLTCICVLFELGVLR